MRLMILAVLVLFCSYLLCVEYKIELDWDEFEGECNGFISGTIGGEYGFVNGVREEEALHGALFSQGEGRSWDGKQIFYINSDQGFFNFWIKDKFADEDLMNDPDLIARATPEIRIYRGNQLLRRINIDSGRGLVCKVFTMDASSSEIEEDLKFYPRTRIITGKVVDAASGDPLEGVEVGLRDYIGESREIRTGPDGKFEFGVEIGTYDLEVFKPDYIGYDLKIAMGADETPREIYLAMSEKITNYRIVLTWSSTPEDLDAHLNGPRPEGGDFHIWYRNKVLVNGKDFLDTDDMDGNGPETITIYEPAAGVYSYAVHDYSNRTKPKSRWLSKSGAEVRVYGDNNLLEVFNVPGDQKGNCWHVFRIDQKNQIIPINLVDFIKDERNIR